MCMPKQLEFKIQRRYDVLVIQHPRLGCPFTKRYYILPISMSERKVINKYIPPEFDPNKIPRRRQEKSAQHTVRIMAPYSMRCASCGEYIYKGRKFNARKELTGGNYLGIKIHRFYVRCPQCAAEITYTTDPQNMGYAPESGATRNFEPWREAKEEEEREKKRKMLEELHNPMRALEMRTYDAKRGMEIVEALDEIRMRNARLESVDADFVFDRIVRADDGNSYLEEKEAEEKRIREDDDALIREAFQRVQEQELFQPVSKVSAKDLLLDGGNSTQTKPRLTAASLGVVIKRPKKTKDKADTDARTTTVAAVENDQIVNKS